MNTSDARADALLHWLTATLRVPVASLALASADASFRRYFRVSLANDFAAANGATTLIAMDAPPPNEDCRPYVRVARLLARAGVHVPRIVATDVARGYLLVEDLGTITYRSALDEASAPRLYADALDALVVIQRIACEGKVPPYDDALLRRELALFPDWYVARHLGVALSSAGRATLDAAFDAVVANNLAQPRVLVHRDYHSRNLMVSAPNPGVLDFQDAVYGPVTYDLVSLLRDAYIEWNDGRQRVLAAAYFERARDAGLPAGDDFDLFWRDFEWMGIQRHLKVLGIFARLDARDGKKGYVADMPLVLAYLRRACARYREFAGLAALLDELHQSRVRDDFSDAPSKTVATSPKGRL